MPFTFSHPALVLPLKFLPRQWFSITGLVIGSLTPDFEYFIRMKIQSDYSHTIGGLFWFDLPLAIIIAFIFHDFVRDSLFDNLPTFLKSRFAPFKQFNWKQYFINHWFIVLISILIGAFSHIFWDSFTHEQGYFVKTIPILSQTTELFGRQIPILKIIQHTSTLLGGLVIAIFILKLPKYENINWKINRSYWVIIIALTIIIVAIRLMTGLDYKLYGHVIVTGISAVLISLIVTPYLLIKKTDTN